MELHLIIPALNEAANLAELLPRLTAELDPARHRVIVADGGSDDDTQAVCARHQVTFFASPDPGRGPQMNAAVAAFPGADIYYFVHADTRPPQGFVTDIRRAIAAGYPLGCYRFRFDSAHPLLRINSFCTRFSGLPFRGGDQSLFVTAEVFHALGGYTPGMRIMEEYDFIERARAQYRFRVLPRDILVSARKYDHNGYFRVQLANLKVFRMYRRGASQEAMVETYRALLN